MTEDALIQAAWAARENAYAPYSQFKVGAVLLCPDERIFTGCNVENISYGLTNCAERVAVGSMVAAGVRSIQKVVVVADTREPISPCGACRQVLAEFNPDCEVLLVNATGLQLRMTLAELLPRASTGILNH